MAAERRAVRPAPGPASSCRRRAATSPGFHEMIDIGALPTRGAGAALMAPLAARRAVGGRPRRAPSGRGDSGNDGERRQRGRRRGGRRALGRDRDELRLWWRVRRGGDSGAFAAADSRGTLRARQLGVDADVEADVAPPAARAQPAAPRRSSITGSHDRTLTADGRCGCRVTRRRRRRRHRGRHGGAPRVLVVRARSSGINAVAARGRRRSSRLLYARARVVSQRRPRAGGRATLFLSRSVW